MLSGPFIIPETTTVLAAVFLLHGFGSDGQDLASLAPHIDAALPAELQKHVAYFSPNAPQPTPFMMGYQWFSDKDWTFRDRPGIDAAAQNLRDYIEEKALKELNITWRQVYVIGFSQGGMTALHAATQWPEELGALVGHSTRLMWPETLQKEGTKHPITLLHGTADDVVPADAMNNTAQALKSNGYNPQTHLLPGLAHGINQESINIIAQLMAKRIQPQK